MHLSTRRIGIIFSLLLALPPSAFCAFSFFLFANIYSIPHPVCAMLVIANFYWRKKKIATEEQNGDRIFFVQKRNPKLIRSESKNWRKTEKLIKFWKNWPRQIVANHWDQLECHDTNYQSYHTHSNLTYFKPTGKKK